eukprot:XP_001700289.1 predicted protein [Chlamydomonas reinhardtii]
MARPRRAGAALALLLLVAGAALMMMAPGADAGRQGISLASSNAQTLYQARRGLLACSLSCSSLATCIKASCVSSDGVSTTVVKLDFTACKGSSIILTSTINVVYGATFVTLQVHDGQLSGNTDCGVQSTCAGCGGSCGDGVCSNFETDPARTVNGFFSAAGGCIAKPTGTYTYTDPLTGNTAATAPLYLMTDGTTQLQSFLGYAVVGASKAIVCYNDTTYTTVSKYIYVERILTDTTNYACLSCSWFRLYTITKPSTCTCRSDTAWAFPLKSVLDSWTLAQAASTTEILLPSGSYPGNVYWAARADTSAWGGYFRFAPATSSSPFKVGTTTTYTFDMCAGCAQNSIGKGYIMGKLSFVFTNANGAAATYVFFAPAPGASVTSSALQVYQSYISPPTFTPGQFKNFDTLSAVTIATGAVAYGSSTANVPTAMTSNGVYIAVHMAVGGSFCDGNPPYNLVVPQ